MFLIVLAEAADSVINPVPFLFFGAIALAWSIEIWRRTHRRKVMEAFAAGKHFGWLAELPDGFPTEMLDELFPECFFVSGGWSGVRNIVGGMEGQDYLLAFDVTIGRGRNSYRRTVVARRTTSTSRLSPVPRGLAYRSVGNWRMLTPFSRISSMWNPAKVEANWEALR